MNNIDTSVNQHSVYVLSSPVPDRNPQGFVFKDKQSLTGERSVNWDFLGQDGDDRNWRAKRLADKWTPREVIGYVRPDNDFPRVGNVPAFSRRAVDALGDLLWPNGELLLLKTPPELGNYYVYNTTTVADVLDLGHSEVKFFEGRNSYVAHNISYHEFHADRIAALSIFRIPETSITFYVTNRFVDRVRGAKLNGFLFMKVWPLPRGTDWYKAGQDEYWDAVKPSAKKAKKMKELEQKPTAVTKWTARAPKGAELEALNESISFYQGKLGMEFTKHPAAVKQAWIQQMIEDVQRSSESKDWKLDRSFWLAIAWGEAMVNDLGWVWLSLADESDAANVVVASPDHAYVVPVLDYFERMALLKKKDATPNLLYNMIRAGKMSPAKPGALFVLG